MVYLNVSSQTEVSHISFFVVYGTKQNNCLLLSLFLPPPPFCEIGSPYVDQVGRELLPPKYWDLKPCTTIANPWSLSLIFKGSFHNTLIVIEKLLFKIIIILVIVE